MEHTKENPGRGDSIWKPSLSGFYVNFRGDVTEGFFVGDSGLGPSLIGFHHLTIFADI